MRKTERRKAQIIQELRRGHALKELLKHARMARSTFYYHLKQLQKMDKYATVKLEIRSIYKQNKGRYDFRRIRDELQNWGYTINHKTVYSLMCEMGLKNIIRVKKYVSYRGEQGRIAENLLNRDFKAYRPEQKWLTDITEFKVHDRKLYLSPMMDLYNRVFISFTLADRPTLQPVLDMVKKATEKRQKISNLVIQSDQGWHYQCPQYQCLLQEKGIRFRMSRKGNYQDKAVIENFFGTLKSELFYLKKYQSIQELKNEITEYIHYYNNHRIKSS
ncbi:IS3 family transposase [Algoriphagus halophilus]|uniref:IS3 family transposase n=1 Tax=Algoriphagus halophilus TaxID=226505 RepID=UPI00358F0301